ncbi:uncharacterized protein B0I36DRAFT_331969 [Microdochium trichocladiopsis]|uniref:Uncharacterized protein n=1 Tax=Microdochium trichocladiopsis TaxID=1682393 RepID=A0A9P8XWW4_9PEZI|nr:uncharacterized protein B0I36DRAFT_331969 [Microdochium trichocladiopsis]KAH7024734.1 hypothetical protein B0I36DRAFT_331969 [Microdochium trichocladiopsis]
MEHTCDYAPADATCSDADDPDSTDDANHTPLHQAITTLYRDICDEFDAMIEEEYCPMQSRREADESTTTSSERSPVSSDEEEEEKDDEWSSGSESDEQSDDADHSSALDSEEYREAGELWPKWLRLWTWRLDDALERLSEKGVQENHMQAAAEIGVMWCDPPQPPPQATSSPTTTWLKVNEIRPEYIGKEFWLQELDKICAES